MSAEQKAKIGERLPYLLQKLKAPRGLRALERTTSGPAVGSRPKSSSWRPLEPEVFARDASGAHDCSRHTQLPAPKTLDDFDWESQPAAERPLVMHLAVLAWTDERANVYFHWPPGTGKTDREALGLR